MTAYMMTSPMLSLGKESLHRHSPGIPIGIFRSSQIHHIEKILGVRLPSGGTFRHYGEASFHLVISEKSPCEKLTRATFMPAIKSFYITSRDCDAGAMAHPILDLLGCRGHQQPPLSSAASISINPKRQGPVSRSRCHWNTHGWRGQRRTRPYGQC